MAEYFDEDIKIAGSEKKDIFKQAENEAKTAFEELVQAQKDGNLDIAKQIGHKMADDIYKSNFDLSDDPVQRVQGIYLLMFAVTVGCERYMPGSTLAKTTLGVFNNDLEQLMPEIFQGSGYSTAMSYYYFAVRSILHLENEIASSFSMLCGKEGDKEVEKQGCELFFSCIDRIEKLIKDLKM